MNCRSERSGKNNNRQERSNTNVAHSARSSTLLTTCRKRYSICHPFQLHSCIEFGKELIVESCRDSTRVSQRLFPWNVNMVQSSCSSHAHEGVKWFTHRITATMSRMLGVVDWCTPQVECYYILARTARTPALEHQSMIG